MKFASIKSHSLLGFAAVCILSTSFGCNQAERTPPPVFEVQGERKNLCPDVAKEASLEVFFKPGLGARTLSFQDLRSTLNSACMNCHRAPASSGGFSFIDSFKGEEGTLQGITAFRPGYFESAEKMLEALRNPDPTKRMPPSDIRNKNPDAYDRLATNLEMWIQNGKGEGTFVVEGPAPTSATLMKSGNLGNCIPTSKAIGYDYQKDRFFAKTEKLPLSIFDTDYFTNDALELAEHGTVAYNVEYPLWADNADKARFIHVPMKIDGMTFSRQPVVFDHTVNRFQIPENTRFYKTFYKKIKTQDKKERLKRIETRLIVVRTPWEKSLFGSYKWDDSELNATLVETPYRDGSPFKDTVFDIIVDEEKGTHRTYGIPGAHRCVDCHRGSETSNFTLGFTPLQIHRRPLGKGGREEPVTSSELSQAERLVDYGVLSNVPDASALPILEYSGTDTPKNIHELRAQGYFVGNCAHCHNPNGLAFSAENGIHLNLTAGHIFNFNVKEKSVQIPQRALVQRDGDLEQSHIWRKVADGPEAQGMTSQMPMHTPGSPDCKILRLVGKWIRSFESVSAADAWEPDCKAAKDVKWIDQDFTWPQSAQYVPRRNDWSDPLVGMPDKYRNLVLSEELQPILTKEFAVGYWAKKPTCEFPVSDLPESDRRPWMMKGSEPKRPFGEIYRTTPGSYFYRISCMKCHGEKADGNSSLARGILNWSGGSVRVANFMDGLFGNQGANNAVFQQGDRNLAPNYLIWMAMEGTRVTFPPELSSFLGRHGAQMLNQLRDKCINQISPSKPSSPQFVEHEIFRNLCFANNMDPANPTLAFDPTNNKPLNPQAVEEWADRAAFNAGWAVFQFLSEGAKSRLRPGNDQCELVFPKK